MDINALVAFVVEHQKEMGADGITAGELQEKLQSGAAVIEVWDDCFAVVELKGPLPHLWLLYVASESRGRRLGSRFLRVLLKKYSSEYHMSLYCEGARRRAFFGRHGFRIESREGEMRRMTTNSHIY